MKLRTLFNTTLIIFLIGACAPAHSVELNPMKWFKKKDTSPQTTNIVTSDNGTSLTVVLSGQEFVDLQKVSEAEKSNQGYYSAKKTMYEQLDSDDIALVIAVEALAGVKHPTNYNDTVVAGHATELGKRQAMTSMFGGLGTGMMRTAMGYKGLDVAGEVLTTGLTAFTTLAQNSKANNTFNLDNDSTFQGAVDDSTFNYTDESTTGLPVNPIDVVPIEFGSDPDECPSGYDPVEPTDPRFPGCSDGVGDFIPLGG